MFRFGPCIPSLVPTLLGVGSASEARAGAYVLQSWSGGNVDLVIDGLPSTAGGGLFEGEYQADGGVDGSATYDGTEIKLTFLGRMGLCDRSGRFNGVSDRLSRLDERRQMTNHAFTRTAMDELS